MSILSCIKMRNINFILKDLFLQLWYNFLYIAWYRNYVVLAFLRIYLILWALNTMCNEALSIIHTLNNLKKIGPWFL